MLLQQFYSSRTVEQKANRDSLLLSTAPSSAMTLNRCASSSSNWWSAPPICDFSALIWCGILFVCSLLSSLTSLVLSTLLIQLLSSASKDTNTHTSQFSIITGKHSFCCLLIFCKHFFLFLSIASIDQMGNFTKSLLDCFWSIFWGTLLFSSSKLELNRLWNRSIKVYIRAKEAMLIPHFLSVARCDAFCR